MKLRYEAHLAKTEDILYWKHAAQHALTDLTHPWSLPGQSHGGLIW